MQFNWRKSLILVTAAIVIIAAGLFFSWRSVAVSLIGLVQSTPPIPVVTTYSKNLTIEAGQTYTVLMQTAGVDTVTSQQILTAAVDVYDLSTIKAGQTIRLVYSKDSNELQQLVYPINTEDELYVTAAEQPALDSGESTVVWTAERRPILYEVKITTVSGEIETSLYEAAMNQGIDERAVIGFADAFQWTIDFAWEVRVGDTFNFIYEERYRDGQYVMPGRILAGKFVNQGKAFYAFNYRESDDNEGFFNKNGESAQKIFLKAPVAFKYISSGFTTGLRYVKAFNISTGHRAIDYAANYGAPIQTVGDGTVTFAGWNGAYGNMVKVRHNGTYQTNYGHMSKIAVKVGQIVKQGQTIGYVGSTGLSTGPHVHFEMEKNGVKINPLTEVLPPSEGIKEENKAAYLAAIAELRAQLDNDD